ncbi:MAG TPA: 6,7-dimethyl-8-ribityllumazine synthase [Thermoanaerobaculia bacterium]|jgi:6,7-dimethyl-8-ribityllumazine synthase|nr:6,7-dimethyl-8-ribityllumazine synthase [Thermoanaerobaculia bacterium]
MSEEKESKPLAAIVTTLFHNELTSTMVLAAERAFRAAGADILEVIQVSGCFEIPLILQELLSDPRVDLVAILGYIEKGETLHGEVMAHVVLRAVLDLELQHKKPVGIGIIGPGATVEQAEARKVGYGEDAANAALHTLRLLSERAGSSI